MVLKVMYNSCPNEWLGSVDLIIYGTEHSKTNPEYGGGFLFKDLLRVKKIMLKLNLKVDNYLLKSKYLMICQLLK